MPKHLHTPQIYRKVIVEPVFGIIPKQQVVWIQCYESDTEISLVQLPYNLAKNLVSDGHYDPDLVENIKQLYREGRLQYSVDPEWYFYHDGKFLTKEELARERERSRGDTDRSESEPEENQEVLALPQLRKNLQSRLDHLLAQYDLGAPVGREMGLTYQEIEGLDMQISAIRKVSREDTDGNDPGHIGPTK